MNTELCIHESMHMCTPFPADGEIGRGQHNVSSNYWSHH